MAVVHSVQPGLRRTWATGTSPRTAPCCSTWNSSPSLRRPRPRARARPLTSDIIKVPSLEEMKKGAKIETIKAEEVEKLQKEKPN
jgi:hypothetical protein